MTPRDLTTMLKNWDDMFQFDPTPSGECHASEMVLSGTTLGFFNLTPLAVGKVTFPPGAGYFCEHLISIAPHAMRGITTMKVEMEAASENAFQFYPAGCGE